MMSASNSNSFIDRNAFEKYSIAHRSLLSHLCDVSIPSSDKSNAGGPQLRSNKINVKSNQQQTEKQHKSCLTSFDQSLYLKLHLRFSKSIEVGNSITDKDRRLYVQLHQKVQKEQKDFLKLAEKNESKKTIIYTVGEEEYDRYRYETALKYPRFYAIKDQVPLVTMASSLRTSTANLQLVRTVLEMGKVSHLIFPKTNQAKHFVNQNYDKIYSRYPICKENNEPQNILFKTPISEDVNAEKLSLKYGSHIVVSSSGLKTLFANGQSCLENDWEIPVVVKQFDGDATRRVVFIDKPFRNCNSSIFNDNLKYQKRALKSFVTHPKHLRSYFFEGSKIKKEASIASKLPVVDDGKVNLSEIEQTVINLDLNTKVGELNSVESELAVDDKRLEPQPDIEATHLYEHTEGSETESDDEKLVIDDCVNVQETNEMERDPLVVDTSPICTELAQEEKSPSISTPQSPPQVRRSLRLQNKSSELLMTNAAETIVVEQNSNVGCDGHNKRKSNEVNVSPSNNNKKLKPVKCQTPLTSMSTLDEIEELQTKMFRDIHKTSRNQKSQGIESNVINNEKENTDDYVPPMTDSNVTYRLWKMGNINLLIRSSVDGRSSRTKNEVSTIHVQPILEYWSSIGGQLLSFTECARQWIGTKIRPDGKVMRVRINAFNYEVVGVEELDLNQTSKITSGFLPRDCLDVLHTILQRLLLLPKGNYLLKHESGEGICNILKEVDKDLNCDPSKHVFDLHEHCKAVVTNGHSMSERILWTPIDTNALLFKHIKFNRIPATFEPKSATSKSKNKMKNKNKSKK